VAACRGRSNAKLKLAWKSWVGCVSHNQSRCASLRCAKLLRMRAMLTRSFCRWHRHCGALRLEVERGVLNKLIQVWHAWRTWRSLVMQLKSLGTQTCKRMVFRAWMLQRSSAGSGRDAQDLDGTGKDGRLSGILCDHFGLDLPLEGVDSSCPLSPAGTTGAHGREALSHVGSTDVLKEKPARGAGVYRQQSSQFSLERPGGPGWRVSAETDTQKPGSPGRCSATGKVWTSPDRGLADAELPLAVDASEGMETAHEATDKPGVGGRAQQDQTFQGPNPSMMQGVQAAQNSVVPAKAVSQNSRRFACTEGCTEQHEPAARMRYRVVEQTKVSETVQHELLGTTLGEPAGCVAEPVRGNPSLGKSDDERKPKGRKAQMLQHLVLRSQEARARLATAAAGSPEAEAVHGARSSGLHVNQLTAHLTALPSEGVSTASDEKGGQGKPTDSHQAGAAPLAAASGDEFPSMEVMSDIEEMSCRGLLATSSPIKAPKPERAKHNDTGDSQDAGKGNCPQATVHIQSGEREAEEEDPVSHRVISPINHPGDPRGLIIAPSGGLDFSLDDQASTSRLSLQGDVSGRSVDKGAEMVMWYNMMADMSILTEDSSLDQSASATLQASHEMTSVDSQRGAGWLSHGGRGGVWLSQDWLGPGTARPGHCVPTPEAPLARAGDALTKPHQPPAMSQVPPIS